jgi:hypothetical protein
LLLLLLLLLQSVINLPASILPNIPVPKGKTDVSAPQQATNDSIDLAVPAAVNNVYAACPSRRPCARAQDRRALSSS